MRIDLRVLEPAFLAAILLIALVVVGGFALLRRDDRIRRFVIIGARVLLIACLALALAEPALLRERDSVAAIAIVDVSDSVRRFAPSDDDPLSELRTWLDAVAEERRTDDRLGLVVFDAEPTVLTPPRRAGLADEPLDVVRAEGTDIEQALRLALAMLPPDAAGRLVLVSDGNETTGDALRVATEIAAPAGVPIDILPIAYSVEGDVQVVRIDAPTTARPNETVRARVVLEATAPTEGRLVVLREGEPIDLNGAEPGVSRVVRLSAGRSVQFIDIPLGSDPVNRVLATFEPADPNLNAVAGNDRAEAIITTPTAGAVLLVRGDGVTTDSPLGALLSSAGLPVTAGGPDRVPLDLLSLQAFDLVVLDNVAAHQLDTAQQEAIVEYVDRLGGGLLMTGGPDSFGAGGWRGSAVEPVLPVALDVPLQLRRPTAALVLVLDRSGSMRAAVAGARASQQEVANEGAALAIESLSARSYVGVIAFDEFPHTIVPLQVNDDPKPIAEHIRRIQPDGGTNITRALTAAHDMLREVRDVERKQVVFLTDGRSGGPDPGSVVQAMADDGITVTTIAVGDEADHDLLRRLSEIGGGRFFPVRNPRVLPRVLVDSVQVVNRPLIREEPFVPVVEPTGSFIAAALVDPPSLNGLVITAPRPDPRAILEMRSPENEPVLAHWQVGLGRVGAFTSEVAGPWAEAWLQWPHWGEVWMTIVRAIARPALGRGLSLTTSIDDGVLHVEVTLDSSDEASAIDPSALRLDAVIHQPDGRREPLRLRQVGPSRFEGTLAAGMPGVYLATVVPTMDGRVLAPLIGGADVPGGVELRRFQSNIDLLRRIAEATGGRLLDPDAPAQARLFDPDGLPRRAARRPLGPLLLWCALALLLADIAARRVAWSGDGLAHAVQRALGRHERAAATAAGSVALERRRVATSASAVPASLEPAGTPSASTRTDERDASSTSEGASAPGMVSATQGAPLRSPSAPSETRGPARPDPASVAAALAALRGTGAPVTRATPDGNIARTPGGKDDQQGEDGDGAATRQSLLEAKRRARKRLDDQA